MLTNYKEKLLDLFYPPICPVCQKVLDASTGYSHRECREKLPWIHQPRCKRCGKPIESHIRELCSDCRRKSLAFISGRSLWLYQGRAKEMVLDYKYKNKREYTDFFVRELLFNYKTWINKNNIDALVPIPLNRKKQRARGYNQAELIASGIGLQLALPVLKKTLLRTHWTEPQKTLSPKERRRNLMTSISSEKLPESFKTILLIDDIYTTGATIDICSRSLLGAGAQNIYFLTLCIGEGV